jgi:hypothetical protein
MIAVSKSLANGLVELISSQARKAMTCGFFGGEGGARTRDPGIMSPLL